MAKIELIDFTSMGETTKGLNPSEAITVLVMTLLEKVNEIIEVVNDYTKDA